MRLLSLRKRNKLKTVLVKITSVTVRVKLFQRLQGDNSLPVLIECWVFRSFCLSVPRAVTFAKIDGVFWRHSAVALDDF